MARVFTNVGRARSFLDPLHLTGEHPELNGMRALPWVRLSVLERTGDLYITFALANARAAAGSTVTVKVRFGYGEPNRLMAVFTATEGRLIAEAFESFTGGEVWNRTTFWFLGKGPSMSVDITSGMEADLFLRMVESSYHDLIARSAQNSEDQNQPKVQPINQDDIKALMDSFSLPNLRQEESKK